MEAKYADRDKTLKLKFFLKNVSRKHAYSMSLDIIELFQWALKKLLISNKKPRNAFLPTFL